MQALYAIKTAIIYLLHYSSHPCSEHSSAFFALLASVFSFLFFFLVFLVQLFWVSIAALKTPMSPIEEIQDGKLKRHCRDCDMKTEMIIAAWKKGFFCVLSVFNQMVHSMLDSWCFSPRSSKNKSLPIIRGWTTIDHRRKKKINKYSWIYYFEFGCGLQEYNWSAYLRLLVTAASLQDANLVGDICEILLWASRIETNSFKCGRPCAVYLNVSIYTVFVRKCVKMCDQSAGASATLKFLFSDCEESFLFNYFLLRFHSYSNWLSTTSLSQNSVA